MTTVLNHAAAIITRQQQLGGDKRGLLSLRGRGGGQRRGRGVLLVTTKTELDGWLAILRGNPHIRLLSYTDSLAKRRQMGSERLRNYDVIITTFDTLKAKELALPREEVFGQSQSDSEPEDEVGDEWVQGRAAIAEQGGVVELSYLHLFRFRLLIVDAFELGAAGIKASSLRGEAVLRVSADEKLGLVGGGSRTDPYSEPAVKTMRAVLGLDAKPVSSCTGDFRL
jgi:hypothetical protein